MIQLILKENEQGSDRMSEIWVAIIGGLSVAIPSVIATISSNKRNNDLVIYRINELDEKVQKYNNLKDRMTVAEKDIAIIKDNIKEIKGAK